MGVFLDADLYLVAGSPLYGDKSVRIIDDQISGC